MSRVVEHLERRTLLAGELVIDLAPATGSSSPYAKVDLDTQILFWTSRHLWRSDGTEAGTIPLHTFADDPSLELMVTMNGAAYFFARDNFNDPNALWRSDGTVAGTVKLADVSATRPYVCGDRIYFGVDLGSTTELWGSDGTQAGTVMLEHFTFHQPTEGM